MLTHDKVHTGIDGVPETHEVLCFHCLRGFVDPCPGGVARHLLDIAPPGKVLRGREHAILVVAPDIGSDHRAEEVQVPPEGANTLRRILRPPSDIHHRSVGQVDTHGPSFNGCGCCRPVHELFGTGGRERHVGWVLDGSSDLLAGSSLEVGGHQDGNLGFPLQPVQEVSHVPGGAPVQHEHA